MATLQFWGGFSWRRIGRLLPGTMGARAAERERAQVQWDGLLPAELPQTPGLEIACARQAAREIGGDYSDAFELGDGRVAVCIGEVSGKGLAAVQLAGELRQTVRALAPASGSPAELCTAVNQVISGKAGDGRYLTLFFGVIDAERRCLQYESAGHCLPLLLRADGSIEFPASFSGVIGIFSHWLYQTQEVALRPGDCLLLLTDGVLSAENRAHEEFGYQRLVKLAEAKRAGTAAELALEVIAAVSDFCRGKLRDDASVVVVRVT